MTSPNDRYSRQIRFPGMGPEGQARVAEGRAVVAGCGALGSVIANTLARAGVGQLVIVDRDFVDLSNLQRQVLFDEDDVERIVPKAVAAAEKLRRVNSSISIEPIVTDITPDNVLAICRGATCIIDGTDNFETRFLLNDAAIELGIPWVYGGCLGASGQSMTILPGETPCLECLMNTIPLPGTQPTCDSAGVLGPAIGVIASIQSVEALKILAGRLDAVNRTLAVVDLWDMRLRQIGLSRLGDRSSCRACGQNREGRWLRGEAVQQSSVLCGRNAVQLSSPLSEPLALEPLAEQLAQMGTVTRNPFLVRVDLGEHTLTVFRDGRAIVSGTEEPAVARSLYAKYIGR